jgi:hypothetical protein
MRRLIVLCCALVVLSGSLAVLSGQAPAAAKPDPWFAKTTRVQFQPSRAADAPIQLDLPKKDWMALPGSGPVLWMMTSKKGDGVVIVERTSLRQALEPSDITDLFAQIETDAIKEGQPKAADFQSRVIDAGERRLVAVQYGRPGVLGSERVRQYSMPVGAQLYRVICIASASQFAAYDPVFSHVAASFTVTP